MRRSNNYDGKLLSLSPGLLCALGNFTHQCHTWVQLESGLRVLDLRYELLGSPIFSDDLNYRTQSRYMSSLCTWRKIHNAFTCSFSNKSGCPFVSLQEILHFLLIFCQDIVIEAGLVAQWCYEWQVLQPENSSTQDDVRIAGKDETSFFSWFVHKWPWNTCAWMYWKTARWIWNDKCQQFKWQ